MAIMDQAVIDGNTVFFSQHLKRVYEVGEDQTIAYPNGWGYTALIIQGKDIVGYCCLKDKLDSCGNKAGKEIDSGH